ncbi:hypothetical protein HY638_00180 [Candidatus Woesearchaeota archaeon]|nr:hypothetical protein [Candidatus Woesearchaeota archaeon]
MRGRNIAAIAAGIATVSALVYYALRQNQNPPAEHFAQDAAIVQPYNENGRHDAIVPHGALTPDDDVQDEAKESQKLEEKVASETRQTLFSGSLEDYANISYRDFLKLPLESAVKSFGLFFYESSCWVGMEDLPQSVIEEAKGDDLPGPEYCNFVVRGEDSRLILDYLRENSQNVANSLEMPYIHTPSMLLVFKVLHKYSDDKESLSNTAISILDSISLRASKDDKFFENISSWEKYFLDLVKYVHINEQNRGTIDGIRDRLCSKAKTLEEQLRVGYNFAPLMIYASVKECR